MRKIPGLDNLAFRMPDLPWGDWQDNILNLNPLLWLDSQDTNASILDSTDVVSLLDKSESLAETNIYTSDFSSGTDNTTGIRLTLTGSNDDVSDGATSKDNCLKGVLTGGSNNHQVYYTLDLSKIYDTGFWFLAPSSNIKIDGIAISYENGLTPKRYTSAGVWTWVEYKGVVATNRLRIYTEDGGNGVVDADGDIIYIASGWTINEIEGNHFTQITSANRPVIDNATNPTKVTFTASNSEYLENTLDVASFSGQTEGSVIQILNADDVNNAAHFSFTNSSTDSNHFRVGVGATNKPILNISSSSGFTQLVCDTVLTGISVVEWESNGSSYSVFVNGVESTFIIVLGVNNGNWWGDITGLDTIRIASYRRLSTTTYEDTVFRELIITSTPLTDSQSLNLANYLISKHGL